MESLTTYMTEHGLVYPVMMTLIIVSSVLAGVVFYYRTTYGTVRKCRFCLSVGKHYDAKPGRECPECGNLHIRKDAWTDLDDERVADYKANYYINKKQAEEQAILDKEEAERKKAREQEEAKQKAVEAEKAKQEKQQKAEEEAARLAAEAQGYIDALRLLEEKRMETVYPGQVVRVLKNRTDAKCPNDDRFLAPGDLVTVDHLSFKKDGDTTHNGRRIKGYQAVYYRRMQGKTQSHFLHLADVEAVTKEDLLPGRFARVKKSAMHLPHPTDPKASLPVDSIIRISSISSDHSAVDYKVAHGNGYGTINPEWLQLVIDPVDYIQAGDTVRVVRNEVKANNPGCSKACEKRLQPGEEVIVNSVQRKGTDGWPNKDYDVITYAYPHRENGMNFLPLYDVEYVDPEPEKFVSPVDQSLRGVTWSKDSDWSKALDKWFVVSTPKGDCLGLCKRTNKDTMSLVYFDFDGELQERTVLHDGTARQIQTTQYIRSGLAHLADKITKQWTYKFFAPKYKSDSLADGKASPDLEALLPTAMDKHVQAYGRVPTTTGEAKDLETHVKKKLQDIYEHQNS